MQLVQRRNDVVGKNLWEVAKRLPELGRRPAQISQAMDHFQRNAQIRFHHPTLSRLLVRKPLPYPKSEVRQRNLRGQFAERPQPVQ